jgi:hypothetical protein
MSLARPEDLLSESATASSLPDDRSSSAHRTSPAREPGCKRANAHCTAWVDRHGRGARRKKGGSTCVFHFRCQKDLAAVLPPSYSPCIERTWRPKRVSLCLFVLSQYCSSHSNHWQCSKTPCRQQPARPKLVVPKSQGPTRGRSCKRDFEAPPVTGTGAVPGQVRGRRGRLLAAGC